MSKAKKNSKVFIAVCAVFATLLAVCFAAFMPASVHAATVADSDDTTATVTFTKGSINLVDAPSLKFGSHVNSLTQTKYSATEDAAVKVSDARGTGEGWNLTVELSEFQLNGNNTMQGARIEVVNPTVSPVDSTINTNPPTVPVDGQGALTLNAGGGAAKVFEADENHGRGIWQALWGTGNTALYVRPGTTEATNDGKASVASMHWSLEVAP